MPYSVPVYHENWTPVRNGPPLVGGPFLTGESTHEKLTPPPIWSCLVLCLIFHLSMKVMDNADMFKPKLIINCSCTLKAQGGICVMKFLLGKREDIFSYHSPFKPYIFIQLNQ